MSMHALEENPLTNFFYYLWRRRHNAPQHEAMGLGVRIPHTVAYEHNFPKGWYYHTPQNGIIRRIGKEIETKQVHSALLGNFVDTDGEEGNKTPGRSLRASGKFNSSLIREEGQIVATYIEKRDHETDNSEYYAIEYFTEAKLKEFGEQQMKSTVDGINTNNKNGILQRYIVPSCQHEEMIQVVWTPYSCIVEKRRNKHNLFDKKVSVMTRGMTYQAPCSLTTESRVAPKLIGEINRIVESIAEHLEVNEKRIIEHTVMYFKTDAESQLWLVWCPIMRFHHCSEKSWQNATLNRASSPTRSGVLPEFHTPTEFTHITHKAEGPDRKNGITSEEERLMLSPTPSVPITSLVEKDPFSPTVALPCHSKLKPRQLWKRIDLPAKVDTNNRVLPLVRAPSNLYANLSSAHAGSGVGFAGSFRKNRRLSPVNRNDFLANFFRKQNHFGDVAKKAVTHHRGPLLIVYTLEELKRDPMLDVNDTVKKLLHGTVDPRVVMYPELHEQLLHTVKCCELAMRWMDGLLYLVYSHFLHKALGCHFSLPTDNLNPATITAIESVLEKSGFMRATGSHLSGFSDLGDEEYNQHLLGGDSQHAWFVQSKASCSKLKAALAEFKLVALRNIYSEKLRSLQLVALSSQLDAPLVTDILDISLDTVSMSPPGMHSSLRKSFRKKTKSVRLDDSQGRTSSQDKESCMHEQE